MSEPIASFAEFRARACRLSGKDRHHVQALWRRGFMAEAIAFVEANT